MSIADLARPEVLALQPYVSARMQSRAASVMLNANESPWAAAAAEQLNRYPEPQPPALLARMADLYGVTPDQLLLSRGSDEALDWLVRAFCRPGRDAIVTCPPTFGMYAVAAGIQGAQVLRVSLIEDFRLDVEQLLATLTPEVKLVMLCSPNNPTGNSVPRAAVEYLLRELSGRALVIVDEAYIEFADARSVADLLATHANLGVLRTLSKAWGLAGARIGALLANPEVLGVLRRVMPPYPLPTPSVAAALQVLAGDGEQRMRQRVATIRSERERLHMGLAALPGAARVWPSRGNFLLVRFVDAAATYRLLLRRGIVVRDVSNAPGLDNCLRISVGTADENTRLLDALAGREVAA